MFPDVIFLQCKICSIFKFMKFYENHGHQKLIEIQKVNIIHNLYLGNLIVEW